MVVVTKARDDDDIWAATATEEAVGRGDEPAMAAAARLDVARRDAADSILALDESMMFSLKL